MIKVTLLYSKYLTDPTGASAVMRYLKESKSLFEEFGVEMDYFTREDVVPIASNINNKVPSNRFNMKKLFMGFLGKKGKKNSLCARFHMYIRSGRAAKVLVKSYLAKSRQSDILFIHEIETCYYYLKRRRLHDNTKIVFVSHSKGEDLYGTIKLDYPCLKSGAACRSLYKKVEFVLSNIDRLGFVSKTSMENFRKNYINFPQGRVFYNLNGIPDICVPSKKIKDSNRLNICCVGTVNERKGQRFIVDALLSMPQDSLRSLHIDIVGDGPIKDELEQRCKSSRINSCIEFWGSRSDIPEFLSNSEVFLLPSLDEGLPISIIEAMRQGLATVSTNVGGIPEMVEDGKTGIIIKPSADGVRTFLMSIQHYDWTSMGKNARLLYETKFSVSCMVSNYCKVFTDVLS